MTQMAVIKDAEIWRFGSSTIGPKQSRNVQTVRQVEQAMTAALKKIVLDFRLEWIVEQIPSMAASKIAASPPYSSIVKKMKVSETVIWPPMRGMTTAVREPTVAKKTANSRKARLIRASETLGKA